MLGRRRPTLALLLGAVILMSSLGSRLHFDAYETRGLNQLAVKCAAGNMLVFIAGLCFAAAPEAIDGAAWLATIVTICVGLFQVHVLRFGFVLARNSVVAGGGKGSKYKVEPGAFGYTQHQQRETDRKIAFRMDGAQSAVSELEAAAEALLKAAEKMPERAAECEAAHAAVSRELLFAVAAKDAVEKVAPKGKKSWRKSPKGKSQGWDTSGVEDTVDEATSGDGNVSLVRKLCPCLGNRGLVEPVALGSDPAKGSLPATPEDDRDSLTSRSSAREPEHERTPLGKSKSMFGSSMHSSRESSSQSLGSSSLTRANTFAGPRGTAGSRGTAKTPFEKAMAKRRAGAGLAFAPPGMPS